MANVGTHSKLTLKYQTNDAEQVIRPDARIELFSSSSLQLCLCGFRLAPLNSSVRRLVVSNGINIVLKTIMLFLFICLLLTCSQATSGHVVFIRDYAEEFQPKIDIEKDEKGEEYKRPPFAFTEYPDQRILTALNALASAESREHEKYIILIFLRHYRAQVELAHQSYELREVSDSFGEPKNPLSKEFLRLMNVNPKGREFLSSGEAHTWVVNHPELLTYAPIKAEMERIDKAYRQIDEQLEKTKKLRGK
jgi:hypothetical protein